MATVISAKMKLVYNDATSRTYTFNGIATNQILQIKNRVINLNNNIEAEDATAMNFANTFVSANGSPCKGITDAQIIETEQEVIYSAN